MKLNLILLKNLEEKASAHQETTNQEIAIYETAINNVFDKMKENWDLGKLAPEDHWELLKRISNKIKIHRDLVLEDINESLCDFENETIR